jgi:hypothetical protein
VVQAISAFLRLDSRHSHAQNRPANHGELQYPGSVNFDCNYLPVPFFHFHFSIQNPLWNTGNRATTHAMSERSMTSWFRRSRKVISGDCLVLMGLIQPLLRWFFVSELGACGGLDPRSEGEAKGSVIVIEI